MSNELVTIVEGNNNLHASWERRQTIAICCVQSSGIWCVDDWLEMPCRSLFPLHRSETPPDWPQIPSHHVTNHAIGTVPCSYQPQTIPSWTEPWCNLNSVSTECPCKYSSACWYIPVKPVRVGVTLKKMSGRPHPHPAQHLFPTLASRRRSRCLKGWYYKSQGGQIFKQLVMANHTHTWVHHVTPLRTETTRFHNSILPTAIQTQNWTSWSRLPLYYLCVVRWNVLKVQMFIHLLVGLLCTQRCCTKGNITGPGCVEIKSPLVSCIL